MLFFKWDREPADKYVYIIEWISPCGYDSYEVGYHLTKKGAYKAVMARMRKQWGEQRYLHDAYHDEYYIKEYPLEE